MASPGIIAASGGGTSAPALGGFTVGTFGTGTQGAAAAAYQWAQVAGAGMTATSDALMKSIEIDMAVGGDIAVYTMNPANSVVRDISETWTIGTGVQGRTFTNALEMRSGDVVGFYFPGQVARPQTRALAGGSVNWSTATTTKPVPGAVAGTWAGPLGGYQFCFVATCQRAAFIDASGNWVVPAGITVLNKATLIGNGGNGGAGQALALGGAGGRGGDKVVTAPLGVTPGQSIACVRTAGQAVSFGSFAVAASGANGLANSNTPTTTTIGTSSGGTITDGATGAGQNASAGGAGGASGSGAAGGVQAPAASFTLRNGSKYGGGGAGGEGGVNAGGNGATGGTGAAGRIVVEY